MSQDNLESIIKKRHVELDKKLERIDELDEGFSKIIDNVQRVINFLPISERKEYLDQYQFMLSIVKRLNYFIKDNFRENFQNTIAIDYLVREVNKNNNEIPQAIKKIIDAVRRYEDNEPVIKWARRTYEDEAKDLEGKGQNE